MTATEGNLLQFLEITAHFTIPVYQRTYSWTRSQCQQLWEDVRTAETRGSSYQHFLGAVVYIAQKETTLSSVPRYLVIDGQQRLTTVSLLLAALCERLGTEEADEVRSQYLVNGLKKGVDPRRKLILTQKDRDTLFRIAASEPLPEDASSALVANLQFFRERLAATGIDAEAILRGLQRMQFIDVRLTQGADDPQLIFESLNATGVKLSQSDLVRNTLLMSLPADEQQTVYEQAWFPLERLMLNDADPERFDNMLRDYLGSERGALVNQRELHAEIQRRLREGADRTALVRDLYEFGRAWYAVALGPLPEDGEAERALRRVREIGAGVAFPFLARLLFRLREQEGHIREIVDAARWTEAYVFRRLIVNQATNTMNKTFITLARSCPIVEVGVYLAARTAGFGWNQRFPSDDEVLTALETRDVYAMKSRNLLLERLENHGRKERIAVSDYTVEHVMPQNRELGSEWRAELGEDWRGVQERRLHTLGNLTLTGYNPELSDRPFAQKKVLAGGFAQSPVRLSRALREAERWDEASILVRGRELATIVLHEWPRPPLTSENAVATVSAEIVRRQEFWTELLAATEALTPLFQGRSPVTSVHMGASSGLCGIYYQFWVQAGLSRVSLKVHRSNPLETMRAYRRLQEFKAEIEEAFGFPLNWRELPGRKSSGVDFRLDVGSEGEADEVSSAIEELARRMAALERAIAPRLPDLRTLLGDHDLSGELVPDETEDSVEEG